MIVAPCGEQLTIRTEVDGRDSFGIREDSREFSVGQAPELDCSVDTGRREKFSVRTEHGLPTWTGVTSKGVIETCLEALRLRQSD